MAGHLFFTVAVLLTLVPRCVAWIDVEAKMYRADVWGIASDIVVGLWVGLILIGLHRFKSWAGAAGAAVWVVLGFLAAEHVRVLGAWPDVRQAGMLAESTFVLGSLLRPTHWEWMLLTAVAAAAVVWMIKDVRYGQASRRALLTAAVGTLALAVAPSPGPADGWRGTNYITENFGRLWRDRAGEDGLTVARGIAIDDSHRRRVDRWLMTDLDGARLTTPPPTERRPNVLLLVIEGLGSDRIAPIHGQPHDPHEAPYLAALCERSLYVPRFVNQQRQTNRGTYALFSGALPLLQKNTPRMSVFASLPDRPYLPGVLSNHGYRTAYLQSSDLAFMGKGPFLRAAGFQEVPTTLGARPARASSGWGVDDVTLMDEALAWIDAAREAEATGARPDQPWFLTVLTVGTHHPYILPEDFEALSGETEEQRAFRYADLAVGHLMKGLDRRGVWSDTLVIVTSDETGFTQDRGRVPHGISEAWGVFMAVSPGGEVGPIDGLFGQSDVALSVLDYLGLAEPSSAFGGRSIFRDYATPRELPFANVYRRQIGVFLADGGVELFGEHFNPIARYLPAPSSGRQGFTALVQDDSATARDFMSRPVLADLTLRQAGGGAGRVPRPLVFIPPGPHTVTPLPAPRRGGTLTKGQYFYAPPDSWVRVQVALTADPEAIVDRIELRFLDFTVPLERDGGGRYTADRTVSLQRTLGSFDVVLRAFTEDQSPVTLNIERAEITVTPLE
ncbi:MAG: LTA synthase family protein [Planctomycetota bacterium]